jgi:glucose/arabinose dehydrogenase
VTTENLPPCGWKNSCRQSFVGKTGAKAIYSYGHRNPQGLIATTGAIWDQEHGPKGGDEINIIKKVLIMDGPL